jgi:hypothetical protein
MSAAALRKSHETTLQVEPVSRPGARKMTLVASAAPARSAEDLMRLLYVNPHDGILVDELLAFDRT